MFKRIFAVVLMLCMLPWGAAYAQENREETEAAAVVTGLGLMQYYDDGDFRGDWYVSFDELACAYFRMQGQEREDAFSELKQDKLLPETAEPEKIAEVSDAVFLMVVALGGKSLIENGQDAGKLAASWGITKKLSGKESALLRTDFSELLFATLCADRMQITEIGENRAEFSKASRLLWDVFHVKEVHTKVLASEKSSLIPGENPLLGELQLSDRRAAYQGTTDWTGHAVRGWLQFDSDREENARVIYLTEDQSTEIQISSGRISEDSSLDKVSYLPEYDSSREKSMQISQTADFIYNGMYLGKSDAVEKLIPENGELELIDRDGDKEADVVKIWDYVPFVLEFASLENETLFSRNQKESVSLKDREYRILSESGERLDLSGLSSYDVLMLAVPKNQSGLVQLVRSDRRVYQGILQREDESEILIGKDRFRTAKELEVIPNGANVTAYADLYGRIVFWERGEDFDYGYVTRVSYAPEEDERIAVKMYTFNHGTRVFYTAKTVWMYDYAQSKSKTKYMQGKTGANSFEALESLMQGRNELIKCRFNSAGELREIAYCGSKIWQDMPDEKDEFHIYYGYNQKGWNVNFNQKMFDSKVRVTERTRLLSLEGNAACPEKFRRLSLADLAADNSFDVRIYDVNEKFEAGVILLDDLHEYYSKFGNLVTKVRTVIGEDDQELREFTLYNLGQEVIVQAENLDLVTDAEIAEKFYSAGTTLREIGVGDVIYYKLGADNRISGFAVLYKNKEQNFYWTSTYGWNGGVPSAAMTVAYFKVLKTYEDLIVADINGARPIAEYTWRNYYLFDSKKNRVEKASFRDVLPGDRVVGLWKWANLNDLIIYR